MLKTLFLSFYILIQDQKLRKISECYETSMCHVNNALTADEQGEFPAAIRSYVHALHALEMVCYSL